MTLLNDLTKIVQSGGSCDGKQHWLLSLPVIRVSFHVHTVFMYTLFIYVYVHSDRNKYLSPTTVLPLLLWRDIRCSSFTPFYSISLEPSLFVREFQFNKNHQTIN